MGTKWTADERRDWIQVDMKTSHYVHRVHILIDDQWVTSYDWKSAYQFIKEVATPSLSLPLGPWQELNSIMSNKANPYLFDDLTNFYPQWLWHNESCVTISGVKPRISIAAWGIRRFHNSLEEPEPNQTAETITPTMRDAPTCRPRPRWVRSQSLWRACILSADTRLCEILPLPRSTFGSYAGKWSLDDTSPSNLRAMTNSTLWNWTFLIIRDMSEPPAQRRVWWETQSLKIM